jgi:hypothetical protein
MCLSQLGSCARTYLRSLPPLGCSYVRGEPWFRFQTRGVKHQLDFHASLHEAAPHTLSIGGSTQELKVIRSAGDSVALDRWEFRDPSLDLFCPLPAAAGDALTACKRAGTKHCRFVQYASSHLVLCCEPLFLEYCACGLTVFGIDV